MRRHTDEYSDSIGDIDSFYVQAETRDSNAAVENYFGRIKNGTFRGRNRLSPASAILVLKKSE